MPTIHIAAGTYSQSEFRKLYDEPIQEAKSEFAMRTFERYGFDESGKFRLLYEEPIPAVFYPRPTSISAAVRTYLASLPRQPYDGESMLDNEQLLSCIQNPQLRKLLEDVIAEQGLTSRQSDEILARQAASSLRLVAQRLADEFLSRSSLFHILSSRLRRDTGKA